MLDVCTTFKNHTQKKNELTVADCPMSEIHKIYPQLLFLHMFSKASNKCLILCRRLKVSISHV